MDIDFASAIIIAFCILELLNVFALGFNPKTPVWVFTNGLDQFKSNNLVTKYLGYWVANVKLTMIALLLAIAFYGSDQLKTITLGIMFVTTLLFFFNMFPILKTMGKSNKLVNPMSVSYLRTIITIIALAFGISFLLRLIEISNLT